MNKGMSNQNDTGMNPSGAVQLPEKSFEDKQRENEKIRAAQSKKKLTGIPRGTAMRCPGVRAQPHAS